MHPSGSQTTAGVLIQKGRELRITVANHLCIPPTAIKVGGDLLLIE